MGGEKAQQPPGPGVTHVIDLKPRLGPHIGAVTDDLERVDLATPRRAHRRHKAPLTRTRHPTHRALLEGADTLTSLTDHIPIKARVLIAIQTWIIEVLVDQVVTVVIDVIAELIGVWVRVFIEGVTVHCVIKPVVIII